MDYLIRPIKKAEYPLLDDFLYEAIFVPHGAEAPPRSIIELPELQVYVKDFGKGEADICFVAETDGKVIGAVWTRIMDDYGHIENGVPSLAGSLYKRCRGQGIGTSLMRAILAELGQRGYAKVSLSVQKANAAVRLYRRLGFVAVSETDEEYLMVKYFK